MTPHETNTFLPVTPSVSSPPLTLEGLSEPVPELSAINVTAIPGTLNPDCYSFSLL